MTNERLLQHAQNHLRATAKVATEALSPKLKLSAMQQRAESVSDYPQDIVRRIAHQFHQPIPAVPPLPADFDPGPDGETARAFAIRCLTEAHGIAEAAASLTDLGAISVEASLILAFGDAAEVRLRIAVLEERENKRTKRAPKAKKVAKRRR